MRLTKPAAAALLVFLLALPPAAWAWRARVMNAYLDVPLLQTLEAEALPGADALRQADPFASGGQAVRLAPDGAALAVPVELPAGVLGLWVYGRVPDSVVDGPWPPVVVEFTATAPDGTVAVSHQRLAYQPMYELLTALYVPARAPGQYKLALRLMPGSAAAVWVDFLEVRNELGELQRAPEKTMRTGRDDAELARLRAWYAAHPPAKGAPARPTPHLPAAADAAALADFVRAAAARLPPLNAQNDQLGKLASEAIALSVDYERYGEAAAGREAALLLAVLADRAPTFNNRYQAVGYLFGKTSYERFGQGHGHPLPLPALALAYDRVFDLVRTDAALAGAVGAVVDARVRAPADLQALLDTQLVQYGLLAHARFYVQGMQLTWERSVTDLLLVLGPGAAGQRWLDRFLRGPCYADLTGDGGYLDYLTNGLARDAVNYNGGAGYEVAVPTHLLLNAQALERLAKLGAKVPPECYDPRANPRLRVAAEFFLRFRQAGGFAPIGGDYGGATDVRFYLPPTSSPPDVPELYRWAARTLGDARFAWLAVAFGRDLAPDASDAEWAALEAAAKGQVNPVLHAGSDSLPGFGYSRLELGAGETDPRFKAAAVLRHKIGCGHSHGDLLDLTLFAYQQRVLPDGGRAGWPWMRFTAQHNLVEVDRCSFQSPSIYSGYYGWPTLLAEFPGLGGALSGTGWATSHPQLRDYRRDVLLVDLGVRTDGKDAGRHVYAFDVLRVAGGMVHTYSTHGMAARTAEFNAPVEATTVEAGPPGLLFGAGEPRTGVAGDPLVSTFTAAKDPAPETPLNLRHYLFGLGGTRFYTALGRNKTYNYDLPFLWLERESPQPLADAYAAVFEPFLGTPNLTAVERVNVAGGATGADAPRALRITTRQGRRDLVIASVSGQKIKVGDDFETDAHLALIAEDADGLVGAAITGGTYLRRGPLELIATSAAWTATITSADPATLVLKTEPSLPPVQVTGRLAVLGRAPHVVADTLQARDGALRVAQSFERFRSPLTRVDVAANAVHPLLALPVTAAEPAFYHGMVASDEAATKFWRVKADVTELWMPLFTPVHDADFTDADGDGQRTVRVTNFAPPERVRDPDNLYYGPFTKPVRMRQFNRAPFSEPVRLTVLRVDEARRRLYFAPPADFDLVWFGWVFDATVLTNEAGTRQWRGNYPAREFRLVLSDGPALTADDFPAGPDGARRVRLFDFGPGSPVRVETAMSVARTTAGVYQRRGNVPGSARVPTGEVRQ